MDRKIKLVTAVFLGIAIAVLSSLITYFTLSSKMVSFGKEMQQHETLISKLLQVDDKVREKYVGSLDDEKIVDGILSGYVNAIGDKYGFYLDKKNYRAYTQDTSGTFEGIGIGIERDIENTTGEIRIRITNVYKNSPAEKAGLLAGDLIIKAKGENVTDLGYFAAVQNLRGKEGTVAEFTVLRNAVEIPFSVTRSKFDKVTVEPAVMLENDIAFIRITEFDANTPDYFKKELDSAKEKGAKSIIFDVRNNPGGNLEAIVKILDTLLPEGPIVTLQYKEGLKDKGGKPLEPVVYSSDKNEENLPMAVLINKNTASAAELFSAALRDYQKGILVGEKTFGKGVGQETLKLGDETAVHFTTFYYKPPKGDNYNGIGVAPAYEVAMSDDLMARFYSLAPADDPQLQKAISVLIGG